MSKYHTNPETGKTGDCRAKLHNCPFSMDEDHYESKEDASKGYERFMRELGDKNKSVNFHFTHLEHDDFTNGDCGNLAAVIHKKTGYPLVYFSDGYGHFDHMAVELPDGRIMDVEGIWTKEDFAKAWDRKVSEIRPTKIEDFKYVLDKPRGKSSPLKTANKILKVVSPVLDT